MSNTNKESSFLFKSLFFIDEFASVTRYSKNRPIKDENNLEHTGMVCSWCYIIGIDIQNKFDITIDFGKLLSGAICHDMDETLTGDIPRPTKYYNKEIRKAIAKIELDSILKISEVLEQDRLKKNIVEDWKNAKGINTIEQLIVKVADLVGVVYKVWQEMTMLNNNCFISVAKEIREVVNSHIETGFNTKFPDIEQYFISHLKDCLYIVDKCISSTNNDSVIPTFTKFP